MLTQSDSNDSTEIKLDSNNSKGSSQKHPVDNLNSTQENSLEITNKFLKSIGYAEGESVLFNLIPTENTRKADKRQHTYPLTEIPIQYEPFNVYFVANGQGYLKKDVATYKAMFCEYDDISDLNEQQNRWEKLGLPEPSVQVFSGGKSIHCYWTFHEPIPKEDGDILILDLIELTKSDSSVKTACHLMRIPPFKYVDNKTHKYNGKVAEIVTISEKRYSYEELRVAIPFTESSTSKEVKGYVDSFELTDDMEALCYALIELLPPHKKGSGTFELYRKFLGAIKKQGFPDCLELLLGKLLYEGDDGYNWEQITNATIADYHNLATCFWVLDRLGVTYSKEELNGFRKSKDNEGTSYADKKKELKLQILVKLMRQRCKLSYNELTLETYLDNKSVDLTSFYVVLAEKYLIGAGKVEARDVAEHIAKENSFHPVKDYLNSLQTPTEWVDITKLSTLFFGTSDPIYDRVMYISCLGAVKRLFEAGCKHDTMCVLQGEQGIGKSAFLKELSNGFISDSLPLKESKPLDDAMIMLKNWFCEIAELDQHTSKKSAGYIKSTVTRAIDDYRRPYGYDVQRIPRASILWGTCNEKEFLPDITGNRRFPVIPIPTEIGKLDIPLVKKYRDSIWYQFYKLYLTLKQEGKEVKNYLTSDEEKRIAELNASHEFTDIWESSVIEFLDNIPLVKGRKYTTPNAVLDKLGFDIEKDMKPLDSTRVKKILGKLGYESGVTVREGNKTKKVWELKKGFNTAQKDTPNPSPKPSPKPSSTTKPTEVVYDSYQLISNDEELTKAITLLKDAKVLGIDTETTGLDPHLLKVRLVQIASENNPTLIIDCFKCNIKLIQPLLINDSIKIFHNAKYDIQVFLSQGMSVNQSIFDTMLAQQLLYAGKERFGASLQDIAKEYLGVDLDKEEQKSDWGSSDLTESQLRYSALDAQILLPLRLKLREQLDKTQLIQVAKIEFDCVVAVAQKEFNGMLLDVNKLQPIADESKLELESLNTEIQKLVPQEGNLFPIEVNLNSNQQLKGLLNSLGIEVANVQAKTLEPFVLTHPEIMIPLLRYKKIKHFCSHFGDTLIAKVHPVTGRIHTNYNQLGSKAGRFTAKEPNIQQMPRDSKIRSCFVAPPNHKLVIADYSQFQIRIGAEISEDTTLIEAIENDMDLHTLTASLILGKPLDAVTKQDRQIAKTVNFGILFGLGAKSLAVNLRVDYGIEVSEEEAKAFIDKFFANYKGLGKLANEIKSKIKHPKILTTRTLANRIRHFEGGSGYTTALNTPVQGTEADIVKLALGDLVKALQPYGRDAKIVASVHDEIILEVHEDIAESVAEILQTVMITAGVTLLKTVPVSVDSAVKDCWEK